MELRSLDLSAYQTNALNYRSAKPAHTLTTSAACLKATAELQTTKLENYALQSVCLPSRPRSRLLAASSVTSLLTGGGHSFDHNVD